MLTIGSVAGIAGCGVSRVPISLPEVLQGATSAAAAPTAYLHASALARKESSWMSSHAASQNLLYVSEVRTVAVYSYPQLKLEGTLRHFYIASGMCVDKGGDVFVVDGGYGKIFEYAHGGTKRLVTLDSPTKGPVGCSIDPTTWRPGCRQPRIWHRGYRRDLQERPRQTRNVHRLGV